MFSGPSNIPAIDALFEFATLRDEVTIKGIQYATNEHNSSASVVQTVRRSSLPGSFGKIVAIWDMNTAPNSSQNSADTNSIIWVSVEFFRPIPCEQPFLFSKIQDGGPSLHPHLCINQTGMDHLVHIDELISSCAWRVFGPYESIPNLDEESILLLPLKA